MPDVKDPEKLLVLDATVIFNFANIGAFDILKQLYAGKLVITSEVKEEIKDEINSRILGVALTEGWIIEYTLKKLNELGLFGNLLYQLGKGEASSIAIAKFNRFGFASDDFTAREIASKKLGISTTGSIGILIKAVKMGIISIEQADQLHDLMISFGYHSPIRRIRDFLGDNKK